MTHSASALYVALRQQHAERHVLHKIAFQLGHGQHQPARPAPNPACFVQRPGLRQQLRHINFYGRTVHDLLKGREYNQTHGAPGFADVLLRPTMVGLRGDAAPAEPGDRNEFANAAALWSKNAGAHPAGATLSANFEIQNVSTARFSQEGPWCSATPRCTRSSPAFHASCLRAATEKLGAAEHSGLGGFLCNQGAHFSVFLHVFFCPD